MGRDRAASRDTAPPAAASCVASARPVLVTALAEGGDFLRLLEDSREVLNTRFAMRRRENARLDAVAVLEHLRHRIGPLLDLVCRQFPERARGVLVALFDVSLDLFAASLLGGEPRHPHVDSLWRDGLGAAPRLLALEPLRIAGGLSNAIHNLATQAGTRPAEWLGNIARAGAACESAEQWLAAGQIAAWQAGMAQYRPAALAVAKQLPPAVAAAALGGTWDGPAAAWQRVVERLAADPWCSPRQAMAGEPASSAGLRHVRRAGAFRGYGGAFQRPPRVACHNHQLIAHDGTTPWQLLADACGCHFHRLADTPAPGAGLVVPAGIALGKHGHLRWGSDEAVFSFLAGVTSVACDGRTLAITTATSHHVYLFAKGIAAT
ncbi:MAG: hypothetical protein AB7F89_05175 [Pirellulaceae bacterium]